MTESKKNEIIEDVYSNFYGSSASTFKDAKKKNFQKENVSVWSPYKYKVIKIDESHGQKFYHIDGQTKPMMRHEILKV